jgi:hypothetical protein
MKILLLKVTLGLQVRPAAGALQWSRLLEARHCHDARARPNHADLGRPKCAVATVPKDAPRQLCSCVLPGLTACEDCGAIAQCEPGALLRTARALWKDSTGHRVGARCCGLDMVQDAMQPKAAAGGGHHGQLWRSRSRAGQPQSLAAARWPRPAAAIVSRRAALPQCAQV